MPSKVRWLDRLRIERFVWTVDSLLYDLPHSSRVETRRDLRRSLQAAADSIGAKQAVRQIGSSAQLAREYLGAEFGERPRHSWIAAGVFALTTTLLATSFWSDAAIAFGDGIKAAQPHATGIYTWPGIPYLQDQVRYSLTNGHGSYVGGSFTPLFWLLAAVGTVLVGRLWRIATRRGMPTIAARGVSERSTGVEGS